MTDQPDPLRNLGTFTLIPEEMRRNILELALLPVIVGPRYTDAEREEMRQRREAEWNAAVADYQHTRELCAGQPAALAALDVHNPVDHYGISCELSESDDYPTEWPCSTYVAIRGAVR